MRINGLGCSLVDNLYYPVDFNSDAYRKYCADENGGKGIITGGLVFGETLEKVFGKDYSEIIAEITGGKLKPGKNIGGPSIVALIHMAQLLYNSDISIGFYGARGNDENGRYLEEGITSFGLDIENYIVTGGPTSFTDVLSDPAYNNNNGERSFINYMGVAGTVEGRDLPGSFFDADVLVYGGTALVSSLHKDLGILLKKGKESGAFNFVNTVYDFKSQMEDPGKPWPLVSSNEYRFVDLLITDNEEAVRISGRGSKSDALSWFKDRGVQAVIITHGAEDILCYSNGEIFAEKGEFLLPVSKLAGERMRRAAAENIPADTTGCGDNFAGGVYASAVSQKSSSGVLPSLHEAAVWGIVSGGFAGLNQGGVYHEKHKGEKLEKLQPFFKAYRRQIG